MAPKLVLPQRRRLRQKTCPDIRRRGPLGKRRLSGKKAAPIHFVLPPAAVRAMADEALLLLLLPVFFLCAFYIPLAVVCSC